MHKDAHTTDTPLIVAGKKADTVNQGSDCSSAGRVVHRKTLESQANYWSARHVLYDISPVPEVG